jgi:hypothetical protein
MTARQALSRLEHAAQSRLGTLCEGVQPLLEEARAHLQVLEPEPGGQRASPQQQQQHQEELAKVLEQVEDVLEALYLAVRARSSTAAPRHGRG